MKKTMGLTRAQMAWRAAQDIHDGAYVNLGIGMPELVANYVPADREISYHAENGVLRYGPQPESGKEDPELMNAGKKPVTLLPGASFFHHADSFAMIRGGHLDICILGAMQVSQGGDIANWSTGEPDAIPAIGGAMDLVMGAREIYVIMDHVANTGQPKLVRECSFPLTGAAVVKRIYTNLAVVDVVEGRFVLREIAPGVREDHVRSVTAAELHITEKPRVTDLSSFTETNAVGQNGAM